MFKQAPYPTALIPRNGDGYISGKKMLYPSPASGRGSRLFTLVHVLASLCASQTRCALTRVCTCGTHARMHERGAGALDLDHPLRGAAG